MGGRWAAYIYCWGSVRKGVGFGETEVSVYTIFLLAMKRGEKRRETGVADELIFFGDVGVLSMWGARGWYMKTGGYDTVVGFGYLAVEEVRLGMTLLMALEEGNF